MFVSLNKSRDSLIALIKDSMNSFIWFTLALESSLPRTSCSDPKNFFGSKRIFTGTPLSISVVPDPEFLNENDLNKFNASSQLDTLTLDLRSLYTVHLKLFVLLKTALCFSSTLKLYLVCGISLSIAHSAS